MATNFTDPEELHDQLSEEFKVATNSDLTEEQDENLADACRLIVHGKPDQPMRSLPVHGSRRSPEQVEALVATLQRITGTIEPDERQTWLMGALEGVRWAGGDDHNLAPLLTDALDEIDRAERAKEMLDPTLVAQARGLFDSPNDTGYIPVNPEYTRGVVELLVRASGMGDHDGDEEAVCLHLGFAPGTAATLYPNGA